MSQQRKDSNTEKFCFVPRPVYAIRAEDHNANIFSDIHKYDREPVVERYEGQPPELTEWFQMGLDLALRRNLEASRYDRPRKIQSVVIPLVFENHDLKVQAETGAGKSCAFLIPIIHTILSEQAERKPPTATAAPTTSEPLDERLTKLTINTGDRSAQGRGNEFVEDKISNRPKAIILEPTREMAIQLFEQCQKLVDGTNIRVAVAFGEYDYNENVKQIWKGCDIVIGTAGRLAHLCNDGVLDNRDVRFFVLDEADLYMMDRSLGDIMKITKLPNFSKTRPQIMVFSATFPTSVRECVKSLLKHDYVYVHAPHDSPFSARTLQDFHRVPKCKKLEALYTLLRGERTAATNGDSRIMVFVNTRRDADLVQHYLDQRGLNVLALAGDLIADARAKAMEAFREEWPPVLVVTDLCARGIDIKDLDLVINYELPQLFATYVHRIGRTGRVKEGRAVSFLDMDGTEDRLILNELVAMLLNENYAVPSWMREATNGLSQDQYGKWKHGFVPDKPDPLPTASPFGAIFERCIRIHQEGDNHSD